MKKMKTMIFKKLFIYKETFEFLELVNAPVEISKCLDMHGLETLQVLFDRTDFHSRLVTCIRNTFRIGENYTKISVVPVTKDYISERGIEVTIIVDSENFDVNFLKLKNKKLYHMIESHSTWFE